MLFNQPVTDLVFITRNQGIRHVIICPGSRNAPLIQGFQRDPHFSCHSIADERSAGYVALGMARELNESVVVLTTSGTAALNLTPAVAEAYHQKISLVVLTADRPREYPPQTNNQIIDQQEIFIRNSKAFYNLPFEVPDRNALIRVNNEVSTILSLAKEGDPGPVHINVQLTEPLYEELPSDFSGSVSISDGNGRTGIDSGEVQKDDRDRITGNLIRGNKVLILAGMGSYSKEEKFLLNSLSFYRQVTVIAENITNLNSGFFIPCPELILGSLGKIEKKFLTPDLVISFGGQVVSKKIRLFVQELKDVPVMALKTFPHQLFADLPAGNVAAGENRYLKLWKSAEKVSLEKAGKYLSEAPFSNLTAVGRILEALPEGTKVHLGNSGTIRYSQIFPSNTELSYYSNRGTSGIDGCLSSAVGAAMVSDNLHVAILGDLSFVYDSNSMWNRNFPQNLKIIVLNDRGGGIFRIIEGPGNMPFFEEFSVAHHPVSIKLLSDAYGLKYNKAGNYDELNRCLGPVLQKDSGAFVLEVETYNCENSSIFKKFYYSIKN